MFLEAPKIKLLPLLSEKNYYKILFTGLTSFTD